MIEADQRRHMRLMHRAKVRLMIANLSEAHVLDMRDFSESGLFLLAPAELMPSLGSLVEVQTTEFENAPIQMGRVVRLEEGVGFAVEFLPDESDTNV